MRIPIGVRDEWGYEGHRGRCRTDVNALRFGSAYLEKVALLCEHLSPSLCPSKSREDGPAVDR